jgi:hypothetical protein
MMDAPQDLINTMLERIALIDRSITGMAQAHPNFFNVPSAPPYPKALNRVSSIAVDVSRGEPLKVITVVISKLIIAGAIGSGTTGEYEAALNTLYLGLIAKYEGLPRLGHPVTKDPLSFVSPKGVSLGQFSGTIGLTLANDENIRYFGAEIPITVRLLVQIGREAP